MKVINAVHELFEALGLAFGGGNQDFQHSAGEDFKRSQISRVSDPKLGKGDGGKFTIGLAGPSQPEAARTLGNIISGVLAKLSLPSATRQQTAEYKGTGRKLYFTVPDALADSFASKIRTIVEKLNATEDLRRQHHRANDIANTINRIPGTRSSIYLHLADDGEPFFNIRVDGIPDDLAEVIAKRTGKNLEDFPLSPKRRTRDCRETITGGRTIDIAMNKRIELLLPPIQFYASDGRNAGGDQPDSPSR